MKTAAWLTLVLSMTIQVARGETMIKNRHLRVSFDPASSTFTVLHRPTNTKFIESGRLHETKGKVNLADVEHPTWGPGRQIVVTWPSRSVTRLTLCEKLPFVLVQTDLQNNDTEPQTLNRINFAELDVTGPKPAEQLKAFGTFGLVDIAEKDNPGSYAHLSIVDPQSRSGVVTGWLTHDRAAGVMFHRRQKDSTHVTARLDHGHLLLKPGQTVPLETLLIGYFKDARLGLEAYADALAVHHKVDLPEQPTVYCTWYHAGASNAEKLRDQAEFAARNLKQFGFDVLQIDDGWQDGASKNGPRKVFIRHKPDGPYPKGMKATAEHIKSLGLVPGIWYMPFAGTYTDPFFADKQDWFAKLDGKPFDTHWGGTCFDLTVPEAREHVRLRTERICRDWGYRYIKIDGMWTGMACPHVYVNAAYKEDDLGQVKLSDPNKTHLQAYREGLKIVREAAGKDTFILGCNLAQNMRTLVSSIGFVDAMRVGPDNGPSWGGMLRSAFSGSNLYFLHRRVWYNDPDPLYVRNSVPIEQAQCFVSFNAVTGQLHSNSFQYSQLPPERLDLLRRAMPSHTLKPRPVDLFENRHPRIWLLADEDRKPARYVVGLFNWDGTKAAGISETYERIGLPPAKRYVAFDFWADRFVQLHGEKLEVELAPASCRVLALRPAADVPQLISTSRHITQGIVDVAEESWDAKTKTLRGASHVVAGDPYELRIARPADGKWKVVKAEAGKWKAGNSVGGSTVIRVRDEEPGGWRCVIESEETQSVKWAVSFQ